MAVVPQVTQGTCARRFSISQIRRRTLEKPPSAAGFPLAFQVTRGTQRQMHTFVEVVAGFPVPPPDIVGHVSLQEIASLLEEGLIAIGERDSGEIHLCVLSSTAFACGNELGDVPGAGAGVAAGQRPPAGTHQIRRRGSLRGNAETTLHMHRHGRGL